MGDLAGIPPFGGGGVNIRPNTEPVPTAVPAVEASSAGQGLSGRMSSGQSQADSGSGQPGGNGAAVVARKEIDHNALPGPPPTFQITLLEMDRDLAETLARINAAHAIARDTAAVAGTGQDTEEAPTADDAISPAAASSPDPTTEATSQEPKQNPGESALKGYSAA